jgi:P27 family predicted phage terminase small subunit
MTQLQKEIWREGLENVPMGLLRALDAGIYQSWVFASYSQRRAAERYISEGEHPTIMTVNGGVRENPLLRIIRSEGQTAARLATEMGFTPTSRQRVKGDGDNEKPENEFNEFQDGDSAQNAQGSKSVN